MLSKAALTDYLARPMRDSRRAKRFTEAALDRKLAALSPPPDFHTPLRRHQKVCFLLGVRYWAYLLFLDMGLGKTLAALSIIEYANKLGKPGRTLVLVPNSSNILTWANEVKRHAPGLTFAGLDGDKAARYEALDSGTDIVCVTYMGWLRFVCTHIPPKGKKPGYLALDPQKARQYGKQFGKVIWDECDILGNPRSLITRAAMQQRKYSAVKLGLTGTPFGADPAALWPQFYLIDGGDTLGATQGLYRAAYFKEVENIWSGWPDYVFDKTKQAALYRRLRNRSVRYRDAEIGDMPPVVPVKVPVTFPAEVRVYYDAVVAQLRAAKAEHSHRLIGNAFTRLRQLASGFLTVKDPADEKVKIIFPANPKLEALLGLIAQVPPGRKFVIFHEFQLSGQIISKALKAAKIKHAHLWGKARNKNEVQRRFLEDPDCRCMLSSSAGARGGNWQTANYVFFYESPVDPKIRMQEEKRCDRMGQTRRVYIYDLVVKGSIEEKIRKSVRAGRDLLAEVVDGRDTI